MWDHGRQRPGASPLVALTSSLTRQARRAPAVDHEAAYLCNHCGEEIVVPIDLSAGGEQTYVEDCPVCCSPNVLHVSVDGDGQADVWSECE